jgi:hypothetical protein
MNRWIIADGRAGRSMDLDQRDGRWVLSIN